MNQLEQDKWVEETMESLAGSQRPNAPADLLERAMRSAARGRAKIVRMPPAQVWSAAACALVLIVANLFICLDFSHAGQKTAGAKERFAKEYFGSSDAPQF
jgi:type VI protein secretion system component VasF